MRHRTAEPAVVRAAITRRCDPLSDADGRIATDRKAALRKAAATREPQPLPALSGEQLSELLRLLGRRHRRAEADCHRCDAQIPTACGRGGRHAGQLRLLGLLRAVLDQAEVKDVLAGRRPVRNLFSASLSSNTSQRCRASSARHREGRGDQGCHCGQPAPSSWDDLGDRCEGRDPAAGRRQVAPVSRTNSATAASRVGKKWSGSMVRVSS